VTTDAGTVPRLTAKELAVWRMLLRVHGSITTQLERDLVAEHGLPLAWYDVLLQLAEAPGQRLRMTDLADRVLLSRSGLTRLVDRLVTEGLVERAACPSDARGTFSVLTPAGLQRLREAAPTHLRGIAEYISGPLTDQDLDTLSGLLGKLLPAAGVDGSQPADGRGAAAGLVAGQARPPGLNGTA
jgi:DNA-binding MarR family transcriptional regulator